ncbi:hypothetical protein HHE06_09590 [Helicobacter heilmannii]|uniref:hypothetical protein n=1 Tax=Helicobacter heilmannii TaxID=35817 RepID=UPI0006A06218|nr:hypothetical protein [Helicobacter heilmannii]CRF51100.1 hypothetical protein HHE06_09590 [Helicobacter heilmannii]
MKWATLGGGLLLSLFGVGCASNPTWVQNCPAKAYTKGDALLACASASIVDGDVDYATSLAGTRAKDKMLAWILANNPKGSGQVELVGAYMESKWISPSQVFVLFSVDANKAREVKMPSKAPVKVPTSLKLNQPPKPNAQAEPKTKELTQKPTESKARESKASAPKEPIKSIETKEIKANASMLEDRVPQLEANLPKEQATPKAQEKASTPKAPTNPKQESLKQ